MSLPSHTYEEIRGIAVDILLKKQSGQYADDFFEPIGVRLLTKHGRWPLPPSQTGIGYMGMAAHLHADDTALVQEVFWDLFRQGAITLGDGRQLPGWPGYRLSRFGRQIAQHAPFRFHDTQAYIQMVKSFVPDVSPIAVIYLEEAVASFYADCLFASCVMLGVAAEAEFLRLVDVACASATFGTRFAPVLRPVFVGQKITKFLGILKPLISTLPRAATEDLDTNFLMIQSVLRIARNEAGHPTADALPQREQVYVNLQLFAPFARQLTRLRDALA